MSGAPPPGWYPDPWQVAPTRWWDGQQWTGHVGGAAPRPEEAVLADPRAAVDQEASVARWLRWAVLVPPLLGLLTLSSTARNVRAVIDTWRIGDGEALSTDGAATAGAQLAALVALTVTVGQVLWLHRAVGSGRQVGVAGCRTPGLAAAGWIIPVVNFWWPYQDVRDLFPADQRPRGELRAWWALHVSSLPLLAVAVAGVVAGGPLALWAPLAIVPPVGAAVLQRELIDHALALHRQQAISVWEAARLRSGR